MNSKHSKPKEIPHFESEDEEREFWSTHDATEYLDLSKAQRVRFPNLKPSTKTISLRLPEIMLEDIRVEAHRRDIPYQSLIKVWLSERLDVEVRAHKSDASGDLGDKRTRYKRTRGAVSRAASTVAGTNLSQSKRAKSGQSKKHKKTGSD